MNIHEFGKDHKESILLIHPSLVKWDYFEYVIPLLQNKYHLLVPALPGYDFDDECEFSSVEKIAEALSNQLKEMGIKHLHLIYGCSMGGSIALIISLMNIVQVEHCVMDGGITPYELPRFLCRLIAVKDYLLIMAGKIGGIRLLEKAFATDDYSPEDLQYVAEVLKHCSRKTIYRTFYSCNNYILPSGKEKPSAKIHYWYSKKEEKERSSDIRFMKKNFPETEFVSYPDLGHAGLVLLKPDLFVEMISIK